MECWKDCVALVTGCSTGIGASIAKTLVKHGMKVVGCARNIDKLKQLSESALPGSLEPVQCDLRDSSAIRDMFTSIRSKYGRIDILVNNAGVAYGAPLLSGTDEQWEEMYKVGAELASWGQEELVGFIRQDGMADVLVNVLALCTCTREAVKLIKESAITKGYIININSVAGHIVYDTVDHFYTGTKHAVTAITDGLRREILQQKLPIRVSSISPGNVNSEFNERLYGYDPELLAQKTQGRDKWLQCDEIADLVITLLSTPPHVQIHDFLVRSTTDHL